MPNNFSASKQGSEEPRLDFTLPITGAAPTEMLLIPGTPTISLGPEAQPRKIALVLSDLADLNEDSLIFYACLGNGALKYSSLLGRPLMFLDIIERLDYYGVDIESGTLWWSGDKVASPHLSDLYIFPYNSMGANELESFISNVKRTILLYSCKKVGIRIAPQHFSRDAVKSILINLIPFLYSETKVDSVFFVQDQEFFIEMLNIASMIKRELGKKGLELAIHH